jgi:hypothetical protein
LEQPDSSGAKAPAVIHPNTSRRANEAILHILRLILVRGGILEIANDSLMAVF